MQKRRAIACLAALLFAFPVLAQRARSVRDLPDFSRILWIGAHPDDESLIAPLLGQRCLESTSRCSILVMTRGENGACVLPDGCGSDLGTLRVKELNAAAAKLGATAEAWQLPDVMSDVAAQWDATAGEHAALLAELQQAIKAAAPTMILTFDPAHGSTCHPAHMTIASLVTEAVGRLEHPSTLMYLETRATFANNRHTLYRGVTTARTLLIVNATAAWHYVSDDLGAHASQFTPAEIASIDLPSQDRTIVLLPQEARTSAAYVDACP